MTGTSTPKDQISDFNLFFKITIGNSRGLIITSVIVGWAYFLAWSICSYPQIFLNFKRKSVIGLSFDFLALNIVGHVSYTIFNVCFYFGEFFQKEYFARFSHGQTPVLLNDVFSTAHGVLVYIIIILQCFVYQVKDFCLLFLSFHYYLILFNFTAWSTKYFKHHVDTAWNFLHFNCCCFDIMFNWKSPLAWFSLHFELHQACSHTD